MFNRSCLGIHCRHPSVMKLVARTTHLSQNAGSGVVPQEDAMKLKKLCAEKRSMRIRFQELEQFGAWHEQFTAECPAHFEFASLNEPVNAEIIHAQHVS